MHYYKRNLGDYAKKAGRLTMLQHGAYTLLIDSCYDREVFPTLEQALEWTWHGSVESPSIGDLRRMARGLLQELLKDNNQCVGTGGLYAYKEDGLVGLRFVVTHYEVEKEPT